MARWAKFIPAWAQRYVDEGDPPARYEKIRMSERPVIVADNDWEESHMAWLGFDDRLAIACGCTDCADAIYQILTECARMNNQEIP